jgi:hypothetical protein
MPRRHLPSPHFRMNKHEGLYGNKNYVSTIPLSRDYPSPGKVKTGTKHHDTTVLAPAKRSTGGYSTKLDHPDIGDREAPYAALQSAGGVVYCTCTATEVNDRGRRWTCTDGPPRATDHKVRRPVTWCSRSPCEGLPRPLPLLGAGVPGGAGRACPRTSC